MHNDCPAPYPSLSIIVPCFNEEENLPPLIEAIFGTLSADPRFLELILIDDGSHDRTAEIACGLAAGEPRLRLIRHARNRGLGAAIRTGLEVAAGDYILYTDADLPFDFGQVPRLLMQASNDTIVIGYRANRGEGFRRWLLSKGYNLLCRAAFGLDVHDINFACKVLPRRALDGMQLRSEGSFIDAELLVEGRKQGLRLIEFPLTYYPRKRGISTLSRTRVMIGILAEMRRYARRPQVNYELAKAAYHKRR